MKSSSINKQNKNKLAIIFSATKQNHKLNKSKKLTYQQLNKSIKS